MGTFLLCLLCICPPQTRFKAGRRSSLCVSPYLNPATLHAITGNWLVGYHSHLLRDLYAPLYDFAGVVLGKPWAWIPNGTDPLDPQYLDPNAPNQGVEGYSVDLLVVFSKLMNFDFKIVPSKRNQG